jgi:hypothetical protein
MCGGDNGRLDQPPLFLAYDQQRLVPEQLVSRAGGRVPAERGKISMPGEDFCCRRGEEVLLSFLWIWKL